MRIRVIVEVVGRHLDVPTAALTPAEAAERYGFIGTFLAVDSPVSSALTRERIG